MSSGMSSGAAWPEKGQMCVCESRCFVTKQLDPRQDLSGAADAIISRTLEPGQMEWVYEVRRMPGDTERLRGLTSEGWLSFVAQDGTVLIRKAELVERQADPQLSSKMKRTAPKSIWGCGIGGCYKVHERYSAVPDSS